MSKMKVGVIGATGMVGQRFLTLLENHPYFEVSVLAASSRSAGKTYEEAVGNRWKLSTPMPEIYRNMVVLDAAEILEVGNRCSFVFCAVDMKKEEIKALEEAYAKAEIPVVSNNSAHRWTPKTEATAAGQRSNRGRSKQSVSAASAEIRAQSIPMSWKTNAAVRFCSLWQNRSIIPRGARSGASGQKVSPQQTSRPARKGLHSKNPYRKKRLTTYRLRKKHKAERKPSCLAKSTGELILR